MTTHLAMPLEVRMEGTVIVVEPPPVYGIRGFTLHLSSASARALAGVLLSHAEVADEIMKNQKAAA